MTNRLFRPIPTWDLNNNACVVYSKNRVRTKDGGAREVRRGCAGSGAWSGIKTTYLPDDDLVALECHPAHGANQLALEHLPGMPEQSRVPHHLRSTKSPTDRRIIIRQAHAFSPDALIAKERASLPSVGNPCRGRGNNWEALAGTADLDTPVLPSPWKDGTCYTKSDQKRYVIEYERVEHRTTGSGLWVRNLPCEPHLASMPNSL